MIKIISYIGILLLVTAWFVFDFFDEKFMLLVWGIAGVGLLALLSSAFLGRKELAQVSKLKSTKFGVESVITALLVIAGVVFVNVILARYKVSYDISRDRVNTLSAQTFETLIFAFLSFDFFC